MTRNSSLNPPVISSSDMMMATAVYLGRTVATIRSTGFSSLADVINAVRMAAGGLAGVVQLSLRNTTRGRRENRAVYILPPSRKEGIQLTFAF